jgi:DNA-binding response OmpR family regulator
MPSPKGRILCTEDEADTREIIVFMLEQEGYEVLCAETAKAALEVARTQTFDLYLLDNWLPDIPGTKLTAKLREFDATTPILFYSAAAYEEDKENARRAGAQGYLVKPIDHETFADRSDPTDCRLARVLVSPSR